MGPFHFWFNGCEADRFFFDPVVPMVGNFGFFLGAAFGLQAKL
jgi:hypothetical protein